MNDFKDGKYGIIWLRDGYKFSVGKLSERISIGICRATNEVAFTEVGLTPNIKIDLDICESRCAEGDRCLYCNCPLNRTTWDSYRVRSSFGKGVKSLQGFKGLVDLRNEIQHILVQIPDMGDWMDRESDVSQGYIIEVDEPIIISGARAQVDET